ncbi:MAG: Crp/Fnr family transcriptional regulator [Chloroflexota bacterium]|nr:Crp/Fnr family transcriptional regulator [Chloroflexota bacterium]
MSGSIGRTWYLQTVDIFRGLSDAEIEEIAASLETRSFRAGELIIGPDAAPEHVYVIVEGTVRLFHRGQDGREFTVDLIGRGRLFGVSALFGAAHQSLLAEAATDVVLCVVTAAELLEVMARWPRVMQNLIIQIGGQVLNLEDFFGRVASADARTRLAATLYRLARDAGEDVSEGARRLPAALTRPALARQIGTSRETVIRALASLESEGYVRREGRRIGVTDPAKLGVDFGIIDEP